MTVDIMTGFIFTGIFTALIVYLGYSDWRHSRLSSPESAYIKYSSPEMYILSIIGILIGMLIAFGIKITLLVAVIFLPVCYLFLKIFSPYFDFLPPRSKEN